VKRVVTAVNVLSPVSPRSHSRVSISIVEADRAGPTVPTSLAVLVAAAAVLAGLGLSPARLGARSNSDANRIVAGLEATAARERRLVESFTTNKTFTIMQGGETRAQVVAALQFTAPDAKAFAILESRGSNFLRDRVINRMMRTEIEHEQLSQRTRAAISPGNYEFADTLDDGEDFVIAVVPRRHDELLFTGRIWITKEGFHLKRIEGELAKNSSSWTRRIDFISEYAPVNGVWLHERTRARVKVRWFGEYLVLSECGPYQIMLAPDTTVTGF
jgi:hypothetical protein